LLNASFEPLNIINWKRALKLVFLQKVEVLQESDREIRSENCALRVPAVVRLVRFVRLHRREVKFSRQNIYARDKYQCQYCGKVLKPRDLTCDHVTPRSRGGHTAWTNIVACCHACNRKKGGRTPEEAGLNLLKRPTRPSWLLGFHARFTVQQPPPSWREYLFLTADT
jgi:5-methylcytosine-specific restriction endonuclease McrA